MTPFGRCTVYILGKKRRINKQREVKKNVILTNNKWYNEKGREIVKNCKMRVKIEN